MNCPVCEEDCYEKSADGNYKFCEFCGYDERSEYEEGAGQKTSQKAKARYTPYRTGGPKGKR